MATEAHPEYLISEDTIGTVKHGIEYTYLGVKTIKNEKHDINGQINNERSAMSKLNVLWDKDVTTKPKTYMWYINIIQCLTLQ